MFAILHALGMFVADLFKSRSRLEAENLFLRHQLTIAMRRAPPRLRQGRAIYFERRSREIDEIRLRPHPYEFFLYYDV